MGVLGCGWCFGSGFRGFLGYCLGFRGFSSYIVRVSGLFPGVYGRFRECFPGPFPGFSGFMRVCLAFFEGFGRFRSGV